MTESKYPPVETVMDAIRLVQSVPMQAYWADEDEPMLLVPDGLSGRILPYHVAVEYGLVRRIS